MCSGMAVWRPTLVYRHRHDVGAANADQSIAKQRYLPEWNQRRECETGSGAKAAKGDDIGAAVAQDDAVAGQPGDRHRQGKRSA